MQRLTAVGLREDGRGGAGYGEQRQLLEGIYLQRGAKKQSNNGGSKVKRRLFFDGRNESIFLSDGNDSVESKNIC